jgi:hypothetical protein
VGRRMVSGEKIWRGRGMVPGEKKGVKFLRNNQNYRNGILLAD